MVDDLGRPIVNLLPEAKVADTPTQYKERDLASAVLRGGALAGREALGMVPFVGEALDVAELSQITRTGKDFYGDEVDPAMYAGMMGAGLVIPNIIERPAKAIGRGVKKFFKFGQKAEVDPFASGLGNLSPKANRKEMNRRVAAIERSEALEKLNKMRPSQKLKTRASDRLETAERLANPNPQQVDFAIKQGNVKNPYDRKAHNQALKNLGGVFDPALDDGYGSNARMYANWLSVRRPELMKRVAAGDKDAINAVRLDKQLADDFMSEAQVTYRGVSEPKDSPIIKDVLLNPRVQGQRAYGEGVYTTGIPGKARTYTGFRNQGSVGVLQTDIDYENPMDMLAQLDMTVKNRRGSRKEGEYLRGDLIYDLGGSTDVRVYNQFEKLGRGRQPAKLKVVDILNYDEAGERAKSLKDAGLDRQFWGDKTFDPSELDAKYLRSMRGSAGFKTAEKELKALNADQVRKLEKIAKRYEVASAVAEAAEIGIVVSPITVAIMRATNDEGTASKYASKEKAQGGMITMKRKATGMSPIRK